MKELGTRAKAAVCAVATTPPSGLMTSIVTGTNATRPPGDTGRGSNEPLNTETSVLPGTFRVLLALLVPKNGNGPGPNEKAWFASVDACIGGVLIQASINPTNMRTPTFLSLMRFSSQF